MTPELYALWKEAFAAFSGAFDTPISRRQNTDEYSQDEGVQRKTSGRTGKD